MIKEFADRFMAKQDEVRAALAMSIDSLSYADIVRTVVVAIGEPLDPERIVSIDHGNYQGTMIFVIGETGYQPHNYWAAVVAYGSCSGCDSLEHARYAGDPGQVFSMALHVAQSLRQISGVDAGGER